MKPCPKPTITKNFFSFSGKASRANTGYKTSLILLSEIEYALQCEDKNLLFYILRSLEDDDFIMPKLKLFNLS